MIDVLVAAAGETADLEIVRALEAHGARVLHTAARGRARIVHESEAWVAAEGSGAFRFDPSGLATLQVGDRVFQAGRFRLASLADLRREAAAREGGASAPGRLHLWVIDGGAAPTDIGSLQAHDGGGTLFQVASQFNCLEAPGPSVTSVARYLTDPTQGPRAAISAFPGTLLRHYAAPDGTGARFEQKEDGQQLELLGAVLDPAIARVRNGYLMAHEIRDPRALVQALEARFESICVGLHEEAEVVLGYDWEGVVTRTPPPHIAQVFTSTLAGGGYGSVAGPLVGVCRQLLRAAYLGTLLSAVACGRSHVVLTLIGGGAFGNPPALIWDAIGWALDAVAPHVRGALTVIVNGRGLAGQLGPETLLSTVRARGGTLLSWPRGGPPRIGR